MQCYVISSETLIQEFSLPTVSWLVQKFAETKCAKFVPMVHLVLNIKVPTKQSVIAHF